MLLLVIIALLLFAFLAFAPEAVGQTLLAGVWLLMIVGAIGGVLFQIFR